MWGLIVPGRVYKVLVLIFPVLNVVNLIDGNLSWFCEILITTSPAKCGRNLEKCDKTLSLKICVTLCDD